MKNQTTMQAQDSRRPYELLLDGYAAAVNDYVTTGDRTAQAAAAELVYTIAATAARSVVKKVIDPRRADTAAANVSDTGYNPALVAIRNDITADLEIARKMTVGNLYARAAKITAAGDMVSSVVDGDADAGLSVAAVNTYGDGMDLIHTAAVALMEETQKALGRAGYVDLEETYTIKRIRKQVLIKAQAAAAQYEMVETTPIQEVYRAVRRAVQASRAVQADPKNGYSYIEDYILDNDTDSLHRVYLRTGKYADLGGGNAGLYTADRAAYLDTDRIITRLGLTDRQATVLAYRLAGHGYKSIAAHLGITQRAVAKQCELIAKKAEKIGFTPENIAALATAAAQAADLENDLARAAAMADKATRTAAAQAAGELDIDGTLSRAAVAAVIDRIAAAVAAVPSLDSETAAAVAAMEADTADHVTAAAERAAADRRRCWDTMTAQAADRDRETAQAAAVAAAKRLTLDSVTMAYRTAQAAQAAAQADPENRTAQAAAQAAAGELDRAVAAQTTAMIDGYNVRYSKSTAAGKGGCNMTAADRAVVRAGIQGNPHITLTAAAQAEKAAAQAARIETARTATDSPDNLDNLDSRYTAAVAAASANYFTTLATARTAADRAVALDRLRQATRTAAADRDRRAAAQAKK